MNLAKSRMPVGFVAAMPDVHLGKGATIGSVFASRDYVCPNAVGVDIGCGMCAVPVEGPLMRRRPHRAGRDAHFTKRDKKHYHAMCVFSVARLWTCCVLDDFSSHDRTLECSGIGPACLLRYAVRHAAHK